MRDHDHGRRATDPKDAKAQHAALEQLASLRVRAPRDLVGRVMAELPEERARAGWRQAADCWPRGGRWLAPLLAGALATLALVVLWNSGGAPRPAAVLVNFELHAPGAQKVELVGSFNAWRPGELVLEGPDPTGYWTTSVRLPRGRYEYVFLIDGEEWRPDPGAPAQRPDGFGRRNSLIEL